MLRNAAPSANHGECKSAVAPDTMSGGTSSAVGASAADKGVGRWPISITAHVHLVDLVRQGCLPPPPRNVLLWTPANRREIVLAPANWDRVIHTSFLCCGLSLPLHNFVHSLLLFYGCQLHHIMPNGVLHLAC